MIDTRTQPGESLSEAQWAELQQIANQGRGQGGPAPITTSLDDLLAPSISHLRPVAEALLQEMRGNG